MQLDPETIKKLAKLTLETKPDEITCEDWVHRVGEYVEATRASGGAGELAERLRVVEEHAQGCGHCAEELEALRALLEDGWDEGGAAAE